VPMARRSFMDLLVIPWVDKTIAILAAIPFVVELYRRWVVGHVNFPRALLGLQLLVIIVVMALRTVPVRVTPNPWYWLLAFVTTYATLGYSAFAEQGVTLISPVVGNGVAVVSMIIIVYSLLSLGRNIGFIPAQRRIVTRGAYSFVRHPIYTGTFISLLAFVLRAFSVLNLTVAVVLVALLMLRGVVEERFLQQDASYAAYLQEVRWRWLPGIA
jgi:protein-S-isoprenylcysteine O-methyltransferase Ste14